MNDDGYQYISPTFGRSKDDQPRDNPELCMSLESRADHDPHVRTSVPMQERYTARLRGYLKEKAATSWKAKVIAKTREMVRVTAAGVRP